MRRMLGVLGVVAILGTLLYVGRPAGHVPLFDANMTRLAESKREGWCAGEAFWQSGGQGDAEAAGECRGRSPLSTARNLAGVEPAFCRAIIGAGWDGSEGECLSILRSRRLWPTYDGGLTSEWNRARRYPGELLVVSAPTGGGYEGRTGERRPVDHIGPSRDATASPSPGEEET